MPAAKEPRTYTDWQGRTILKPGEGERGGLELLSNIEDAKAQAVYASQRYKQYRYVVQYKTGFVVTSYADLWDYFGDEMKEETVYQVNPTT